MTDSCETQQVILQENGIIRDASGKFLGRMVEDIDSMCEEQYRRGRRHELEACAKLCETQENHDDPLTAYKIAEAIRARSNLD